MISDHSEILGPSFFKQMTLVIKAKKQTLNENSCFHLNVTSVLKKEKERETERETETETERIAYG